MRVRVCPTKLAHYLVSADHLISTGPFRAVGRFWMIAARSLVA